MGIELLAPLMTALSPIVHPYILLALVALFIGLGVWRTIRAFRREDAEEIDKRWDRLGVTDQRQKDYLERELDRARARCAECDAELEAIEEKLRAERWKSHELERQRRDAIHDRNNLRHTVSGLMQQLGKEPPEWPADPTS